MLHHRMVGEADLAGDADASRLRLNTLELDAVVEFVELDAVEHAEKIEVPIGSAKFTVGRELEADLFLFRDDLFDLAILDVLELRSAKRALFALGPRFLQRLAA